ncbi:MAG: hormogonium polysaccharide biosynthesis glycosyltransferase HpsE [Leptolyngbyaceae cyanobacterium bins.59]|nr:hormogonium polysaccharide biosynthesis glycosyltransferase HpsE [Leptolyngbyaceae cyanobacterium bins.59]
MTDFTIAICTYNGAKRFPEVLDRLKSQVGIETVSWEVLLVDNNSTDNTAEAFQTYQATWSRAIPLKYCFEPQQGAGYARKLAIRKAQSDLVGFLDDDNLPESGWVAAALAFAEQYPKAGAFGSQIHGLYETPPPPELQGLLPFLAIVERGSRPLRYEPAQKLLPPSAGLVVRKQAWLATVPERCILNGRTQDSMLTGEDLEVISYIQQGGWEIWYNPAMEMYHKIPTSRLQREYLIPFFQGIGLSRHVTRMLSVQPAYRPLATIAYAANDLRKIAKHLLKYGPSVRTDLKAACEMELFRSSLLSPLYIRQQNPR